MIVREKECRIAETMRIMGMNDLSYWLSWYVHYSIISTIVATVATLLLMINVLEHTNPGTIWILLVIYAQAIFA